MGFQNKGKGTAAPKAATGGCCFIAALSLCPLGYMGFTGTAGAGPSHAPLSSLRRPPTCSGVAPSHLERADSCLVTTHFKFYNDFFQMNSLHMHNHVF